MRHARVRVRNLTQAIEFYTGILGLRLTERVGESFAFLSNDEAHHQVALQAVGSRARKGVLGRGSVDHLAFEARSERELAEVYRRLADARIDVLASDNGISWALYFEDPDHTRLEVYVDRRTDRNGRRLWRGRVRPIPPRVLEGFLKGPRKG